MYNTKAYEKLIELEQKLTSLATSFLESSESGLDQVITEALAAIGEHFDADRVYLFQNDAGIDPRGTFSNTHEWTRDDVSAEIANLKQVDVESELPWFFSKMMANESVCVDDVRCLPDECRAEKGHWLEQGITSILVVPIYEGDALYGFMGVDMVGGTIARNELVLASVKMMAQLTKNAILRVRSENRLVRKKLLMESIVVLQQDYMDKGIYYGWCERTLQNLIDLTDSEIGFICELMHQDDGTPFIKSHGISNIAWNDDTDRFYNENVASGLDFFNFDSLWGSVFKTGEPVIANDPDADPRRGGYPKESGHPPLKSFLGMPIRDSGGEIVGIMAVSNREDGYSDADVEFLKPLLGSYGLLIEKSRLEQEKQILQEEKDVIDSELDRSIQEIEDLRNIFPICMHCKKVRDDDGLWNRIEDYLSRHAGMVFSHGICDSCMVEHHPDVHGKKNK